MWVLLYFSVGYILYLRLNIVITFVLILVDTFIICCTIEQINNFITRRTIDLIHDSKTEPSMIGIKIQKYTCIENDITGKKYFIAKHKMQILWWFWCFILGVLSWLLSKYDTNLTIRHVILSVLGFYLGVPAFVGLFVNKGEKRVAIKILLWLYLLPESVKFCAGHWLHGFR